MKKELLTISQLVTFKVDNLELIYRVTPKYLKREGPNNNAEIFNRLGIKNKNKFCDEIYGYNSIAGLGPMAFPETFDQDFSALTRVYNALQELCDEYNGVTKEITYEIY